MTVAVAAAVGGTTFELRTSANSRGVCAIPPSGFKERTLKNGRLGPPTVVLTNFRFGRMDYFYGIHDPLLRLAPDGVLVAVSNVGATKVSDSGAFRVLRRNFGGIEGGPQGTSTQVSVISHGRLLEAWVEVGSLTPQTVSAANAALAGVRTCSA